MANSNRVKFQTKLNKISFELTHDDVQRMKYLLAGIISDGHLEECKLARDLFDKLRKLSKLDENDCEILRELLELIDHQKLIKDHLKDLPHSETKQISHFRRVMFQIGKDLKKDDFKSLVFTWQDELSASVIESGCVWTTFRHLEKKEIITEKSLLGEDGLEGALRDIERDDLANLLRKEFKPAPVLIHSATWPPDQSTACETTLFDYWTSMPHATPTTKPSSQVGLISHTPETSHAGPELLTPDFFAGTVPTDEMRGLSLSPHQGRHQLHPQYANYPMPGLVPTPRPSRSHENLAVLPGDYPSFARPSPVRSVSTTLLRVPEDTSSFMFSHLHGSGNQSHQHEGSGDPAFNSQTEQSIQFVDNSMVQGSLFPRTHHDDTDIGRSRNQKPAVGIRQWMTPSGPSRPAWETGQVRMTQPGPADLLFTRDNHYPSRPPDQNVSRQLLLAWEQGRGTHQLRGMTQSGNAEVASGTTSGGFATRVVPAPNPRRPAWLAEWMLIPERMTRGLDTTPTVGGLAEPMNVETPQTGEGLARGSVVTQPHAGLARGSEATHSPGDPSMSSEPTPASTGLSSGFEARQTHGPFASGSEAQQPPGEVTSSSEADPAAGGLSAGSEEFSVGSETSLSSSASAGSHTSTMTTTASTVESPQIMYPQSASEEGSTVASNPLQESSTVIHDPSTQWKETKMGHRLKIFTYDQMSKVANQFKDEICCEGGFGNVYKGKLTLECGVTCAIAIKRMKIESRTDQGEREFQREQSVASVRHPFIVPVLGVCEEPGKPLCIVYPYMEGGDLKGAIDTMDSRLTWQKCLAIITQVSSALIYMHSHNPRILHLDVKPANILLDAFFNARLGDVGLSREIDPYKSRASLTSSHPGTPGYQDPIMMQDWSTSPTNDIYSLGVVMFRALTRKPAFHECEKKPYCVFLKRKGYLKDIEKVLELASKDIWPLDSTSESLSFTRKFAELMCSCLMTDPSERIELEDLHEQIKTLARDASCQIYTEPAEAKCRNLCVICYSNLRVPSLPLLSKDCRSSCDKVCLQCHLDSHKNPLVCPEHGEAKPPIGHCNSYAIFIGAEDFHLDAARLHRKFTNPDIGAIRKENAVLMTEKSEGDLKPSPENILRQLILMKEKMAGDEEASLIFYFSGHGSKRGSKLICNSSKEGLEASQLRQKIHGMNFTQLLVILDCCYAAELGPLPSGFFLDRACSVDSDTCLKEDDDVVADSMPKFQDHGIPILYKLVETDIVEKGTPSKSPNYSVMQWSASKSQETSVGYLDGTSLFTRHIIAGLQAAKRCPIKISNSHPDSACSECPRFRDKVTKQMYITLNELVDYVHSHVTKQVALLNRSSQTPQTVSQENTRNRKIAYCKPA